MKVESGLVPEAPGALTLGDPPAEFLAGQRSEQVNRAFRADISHPMHFLEVRGAGAEDWSGLPRTD